MHGHSTPATYVHHDNTCGGHISVVYLHNTSQQLHMPYLRYPSGKIISLFDLTRIFRQDFLVRN